MDSRFPVTREEFYNVQMDLKQLEFLQQSHADRLLRLEKRQADDAAIKSAWHSPFPSVMGGTPQHGPVQMPPNEVFDDFDEQGQNLLGSLHLDAEDEPVRRGAASRANSVRFDESALQGSAWGGRHSGEFGPARPSSGLGSQPMMERSLSHKSDGRHSSAGHSVHSAASGRANSFGIETNFFLGGRGEDSPLPTPEPPPGLFVLGSVPSIVRCWLTTSFLHNALLYAAVCSGSQKSTITHSLLKELDLANDMQRDADGIYHVALTVYLTEAVVLQSSARSPGLPPQVPSILVTFQVTDLDRPDADSQPGIRIFLGSDALRAGSADILFSQNRMAIYSNDRDRLSIPFVRPEDDAVFKDMRTTSTRPERPALNAAAAEFVSDAKVLPPSAQADADDAVEQAEVERENDENSTPSAIPSAQAAAQATVPSNASESGTDSDKQPRESVEMEPGGKEQSAGSESSRRESATGIWASWRQGSSTNGGEGGQRENGLLSGYQPAGRGTRNMKVLKPGKAGSSSGSARTGASYEPPPPPRSSGEYRRKSHASSSASNENSAMSTAATSSSSRWEMKRSVSHAEGGGGSANASGSGGGSVAATEKVQTPIRETRTALQPQTQPSAQSQSQSQPQPQGQSQSQLPRSANPVGHASAFSWMTPATKSKASAAAAE